MCEICERFPLFRNSIVELGVSIERHGTLFQCQVCREYFELIAEERSTRKISQNEIVKYYTL